MELRCVRVCLCVCIHARVHACMHVSVCLCPPADVYKLACEPGISSVVSVFIIDIYWDISDSLLLASVVRSKQNLTFAFQFQSVLRRLVRLHFRTHSSDLLTETWSSSLVRKLSVLPKHSVFSPLHSGWRGHHALLTSWSVPLESKWSGLCIL